MSPLEMTVHEFTTTEKRSTTSWERYADSIAEMLSSLVVTDRDGHEMRREAGFRIWCEWTLRAHENRGCLFFVGNGASAAMASHTATDVGKNARVRTQVFTDPALMTAVANDVEYAEVFAEPLAWMMNANDVLVGISSSGQSPNVTRAVEKARDREGHSVTLSAMQHDNPLRRCGDLNFYIPASKYGLAETTHAAILHHFVDRLAPPTQ